MEMIKKTFKFEMKEFKEDGEFFEFEGYLSTWDKDFYNDVIVKGAFKGVKAGTPLLWSHKAHEPLGIFFYLKEDDIGLFVKGRMPVADEFVKNRIIPQMKIGSIKSMSVGFSIPDYEKNVDYADGVRYIKLLKLWEGSLVVIPANEHAQVKELEQVDNLEDLSERELEKLFQKGMRVSFKNAKMLVSFVKAGYSCKRDAEEVEAKNSEKEAKSADWTDIIKSMNEISNT